MKKLINLMLMMLLAVSVMAQEKPPHMVTNTAQVMGNTGSWAEYFMGIPYGPTPSFPAWVPDSLKCGALYFKTGADTVLCTYNCTSASWVKVGGGAGYTLTGAEIATALGYTAANDANVVHKTGTETIAGDKTISGTLTVPDATTAHEAVALDQLTSGYLPLTLPANEAVALNGHGLNFTGTYSNININNTSAGNGEIEIYGTDGTGTGSLEVDSHEAWIDYVRSGKEQEIFFNGSEMGVKDTYNSVGLQNVSHYATDPTTNPLVLPDWTSIAAYVGGLGIGNTANSLQLEYGFVSPGTSFNGSAYVGASIDTTVMATDALLSTYQTKAQNVAAYAKLGATLNVFTGVQQAQGITVTGSSGSIRPVTFNTGSLNRWEWYATSDAETGSNVGSNLGLYDYNDDGSPKTEILQINRASDIPNWLVHPTILGNPIVSTDANGNISANNFIPNYTPLSGTGTTTLTASSSGYIEILSGIRTILLPVVSTLSGGAYSVFINNSNPGGGFGIIESSGGNSVVNFAQGGAGIFTYNGTSGTTAASWTYLPLSIGQTLASTQTVNLNGFGLNFQGNVAGVQISDDVPGGDGSIVFSGGDNSTIFANLSLDKLTGSVLSFQNASGKQAISLLGTGTAITVADPINLKWMAYPTGTDYSTNSVSNGLSIAPLGYLTGILAPKASPTFSGPIAFGSGTASGTGTVSETHIIGTTDISTPLLFGGTTTTSPLTLKSTTGVGTTGADVIIQVGNNGATEAARFLNAGTIKFPHYTAGIFHFDGSGNATSSPVANTDLSNSTISGVALGSNLFAHTAGYGLSGSSYTGASAIAWTADTTSSTALVSKTRLATNLGGYVKSAAPVITAGLQTNQTLTAVNSSATLTAAQMASGVKTTSTSAVAFTTATGTNLGTQFSAIQGTYVPFVLDNHSSTSSGAITITLGSGVTSGLNAGLTVATGKVAVYMIYFTSSTTAVMSQIL